METSMQKASSFKRNEHIKKSADFKRLFKNGEQISISSAKLFYAKNNLGKNRIGLPLPRGYGNAVQRNMSRRYSREAYRLLKTHLNTGYDMLFLLYSGKDSFRERHIQIQSLCEKAGLLKK